MVTPMRRQHTLSRPIHVRGIGLHGGQEVSVRVLPAPPDAGLSFTAAGQPDLSPIPARYDQVVGTQLATTLGDGHFKVATVEHLLAALLAEGVDNAEIEVSGEEIPVLDGSAAPWVEQIRQAGRTEQQAPRRTLVVTAPVEVIDGERIARLVPAEGLEVAATIIFDHPDIGQQQLELRLQNGTFGRELAWARTFGFLAEVEAMHRMGLALGGSLDNAVVYDQDGVVNPDGLRSPDEAVRHKLLDMVGDLALAGVAVQGRFEAIRPGHALNQALVRALFDSPESWEMVEG
ncbi:MAG: UDP-3-O-[3-hydroxymyristoyl] N-acetylglucosamine deacetylase [Myxococcota bacterium]|jgi:UDP-3-O-[3-hydroxymyristoyl] N-acetylglucosamine deacetylase